MVIWSFEELSLIMILFSEYNKEDCVKGMRSALPVPHPRGTVIALTLFLAPYHTTETYHPLSGRFSPCFLLALGEQSSHGCGIRV